MGIEIVILALFIASLGIFVFSIIRLVRMPKSERTGRWKYRLLLAVSTVILALYTAFFIWLGMIIRNMEIYGM